MEKTLSPQEIKPVLINISLILNILLNAKKFSHSLVYSKNQLESVNFEKLSSTTKSRIKLLESLLMRHFYLEQGAARTQIPVGINREPFDIDKPAYIANRTVLLQNIKQTTLARLIEFWKNLDPSFNELINSQIQENITKLILKNDQKAQSDIKLPEAKILTIDISSLKAIDNAGQGDFTLYQIAGAMIKGCQRVVDEFSDLPELPIVSVYRVGGDEFTILIKAVNQDQMNQVLVKVELEIIDRVKQIETIYGYFDSNNTLTSKNGLVNIKNGTAFDESRPKVRETGSSREMEESQIRGLIYDLLLCEIGLIPERSNIDYAMSEIQALPGASLMEKFESYFVTHWIQIIAQETAALDFEAKNQDLNYQKPNVELVRFCEELANKFPGIKILLDLAKKTDKSVAKDTGEALNNFYLRYLAQYLVNYMHDPVLGDMAYNKHAFDELVKARQLSGLIVFKEVIKGINDNLGLANGDAVIRACFQAIKIRIPPEIEQFVIFGRSQADIMIGFNSQALDELSSGDRVTAMQEINLFISQISEMSQFECDLNTKTGLKNFILNIGVGAAKLNLETGFLEPKEYGQCFSQAEFSCD